jgi:hypothetical protein
MLKLTDGMHIIPRQTFLDQLVFRHSGGVTRENSFSHPVANLL